MSEKVHIGYVCGRGNGHLDLRGDIEYGVCGSKSVADVYVVVEDHDGLYEEYQGLKSAEDVADELSSIVKEWSMANESAEWSDYDEPNSSTHNKANHRSSNVL